MLAHVVAEITAAKFNDRSGQRCVGGGVGALAGELAERSVDDGYGLGRRIHGNVRAEGSRWQVVRRQEIPRRAWSDGGGRIALFVATD